MKPNVSTQGIHPDLIRAVHDGDTVLPGLDNSLVPPGLLVFDDYIRARIGVAYVMQDQKFGEFLQFLANDHNSLDVTVDDVIGWVQDPVGFPCVSDTTAASKARRYWQAATDIGVLRGPSTGSVGAKSYRGIREKSYQDVSREVRRDIVKALMTQRWYHPRTLVFDPAWAVLLESPEMARLQLLDLHQYRLIDYQEAGSLVSITVL